MVFFVVSRRALLRDLIASFCAGEGIKVHGVAERLSDIDAPSSDPVVLLHLAHGDRLEAKEIETFRARYGEARIVILCSRQMYGKLQSLPTGLVEAMVLDDSSLRSLSGVLTLVHEGFMITRAEPHEAGDLDTDPAPDPIEDTPEEEEGVGRPRRAASRKTSGARLSRRETAVIRKLCEGASNKDIANALNIGESTVKVHLRACYRKIGVRNRTQAAIWAAKHLHDLSRIN